MAAIEIKPHGSHCFVLGIRELTFAFSTDSKAYNSLLSVRSHLSWLTLQYYCSFGMEQMNHIRHLTDDAHD